MDHRRKLSPAAVKSCDSRHNFNMFGQFNRSCDVDQSAGTTKSDRIDKRGTQALTTLKSGAALTKRRLISFLHPSKTGPNAGLAFCKHSLIKLHRDQRYSGTPVSSQKGKPGKGASNMDTGNKALVTTLLTHRCIISISNPILAMLVNNFFQHAQPGKSST